MNEKRYKSVIVLWGVIFLVLHTLSLINVVGLRPFAYTYVALIVLALVIIFMGFSLKKKKAGPIIGIILGAIYILNFNLTNIFISIVNLVAGVCFIISCAGMLRFIAKENKKQPEKEEKQTENA